MKAPNKAEKAHHARLREMGCLICHAPASIHHERPMGAKTDHKLVLPLCPYHHQTEYGPQARHSMRREKFEKIYEQPLEGLTLIEWAKREWEKSNEG